MRNNNYYFGIGLLLGNNYIGSIYIDSDIPGVIFM
jgi:hypothetical protein